MESVKEIMRLPAEASAEIWMPVLDLAAAVHRHNLMVEVSQQLMASGVDYGVIPGTNSRPVLLKPGAEKLCSLFGLSPEVAEERNQLDWTGEEHNEEPFFYFYYRVKITKNGILLGEGVGSANSWEAKYRWRKQERTCPDCGTAAIIRGREEYGGGWVCFTKKGGCGAKFKAGDPVIEKQKTGRIPNPDVADLVNTLQKMAYKRALIAGVLIATNASEFFTQDLEDQHTIDVPVAEEVKNGYREMIEAFAVQKQRIPDNHDLYYTILAKHGVEHSNEFDTMSGARACYRELKEAIENFLKAQPEKKSPTAAPTVDPKQ